MRAKRTIGIASGGGVSTGPAGLARGCAHTVWKWIIHPALARHARGIRNRPRVGIVVSRWTRDLDRRSGRAGERAPTSRGASLASLPHMWATIAMYGQPLPCMGSHIWAAIAMYGQPVLYVGNHCHVWAAIAMYWQPLPCMGNHIWAAIAMHGQSLPCMGSQCHVWAAIAMYGQSLPCMGSHCACMGSHCAWEQTRVGKMKGQRG